MRLREIVIERYGPIGGSKIFRLSPFTLLWGENEEGKTLSIEALLKMLLRRGFKSIKFPARVEEEPIGRVGVEIEEGVEVAFPNRDKKSVVDYLSISPELFRDLFVITNSDLVLANESRFYVEVTENLTGLRKRKIDALKEKLREIGMLTPGNDFEDSKRTGKFKSRISGARKLIEEIDSDVRKIRERGYDKLEENLMYLMVKRDRLKEKLLLLERAKQRKDFDKYLALIEELAELIKEERNYRGVSEEELERLRGFYRDIEALRGDIERERERIGKIAKDKQVVDEKRFEREAKYRVMTAKQGRVERELKEKIRDCERREERVMGNKVLKRGLGYLISVFVLLSIISGVGSLVEKVAQFAWAFLIGIVLSILLVTIYLFVILLPTRVLERERRRVLNLAASIGIAHGSLNDIREDMVQLEEGIKETGEILRELGVKIGVIEEERKKLEEEIARKRETIAERERTIEKILALREVGSIDEYRNKLDARRKIDSRIKSVTSLLADRFGGGDDSSLSSRVRFWRKRIEELRSELQWDEDEQISNMEYSDSLYYELREKLRDVEELLSETQSQLEEYHSKLNNYNGRVEYILTAEIKDFDILSLNDLLKAKKYLEDFVRNAEKRRDYVLRTIEILEMIGSEEEEKIRDLFREKPGEYGVSKYFKEITDGLYVNVDYNPEKGRITVERRDGKVLSPQKLSGGAFDQLYFAIRVAFGEKIFPKRRGFFILDDPFLKSDRKRLVRQIDLLVNLVERGWQILYFSAKDEIKRLFEERREENGFISIVRVSELLPYRDEIEGSLPV